MSGSAHLRSRSAAALLPASLLGAVLVAAPFAGTTTMPLVAGPDAPPGGPPAALLAPRVGQPGPLPHPGAARATAVRPPSRPVPAPGPALR